MGDHHIGRDMEAKAGLWWAGRPDGFRPTKAEAMDALDRICGPHRDRDAEFESTDPDDPGAIHPDYEMSTDPDGPIGRLIAVAFDAQPGEVDLGDDDDCPWFDGPYTRFSDQFGFR